MKNSPFNQMKINRLLDTQGVSYIFTLSEKDDYKNIVLGTSTTSLVGLFHESHGFVSANSQDAGIMRSKPQPMIFCKWEDAKEIPFQSRVTINSIAYKVVEIRNIANLSVFADISLELVENGQ